MTDDQNTAIAGAADKQLWLLLNEIEKEIVPQRLLDLAFQLQKALADRHAGVENADHPA